MRRTRSPPPSLVGLLLLLLLSVALAGVVAATPARPGRDAVAMAATCEPGYYLGAQDTCLLCDPSCATCSGPDVCDTCRTGMVFMSMDASEPSRCTVRCPPGQVALQSGRCGPCSASCSMCDVLPSQCTVCAPEYGWSNGNAPPVGSQNSCIPCPANCLTCSGTHTSNRCFTCNLGYVLSPQGTCVASCPDGTGPDADRFCRPCHGSCATCKGPAANQCTSCPQGMSLSPGADSTGTCTSSCAPGTYFDVGASACQPCHESCGSCFGPDRTHCLACLDKRFLKRGQCVTSCGSGHYLRDLACHPCNPSCRSCAGPLFTDCVGLCPDWMFSMPAVDSPKTCVPGCGIDTGRINGFNCTRCGVMCAECAASADPMGNIQTRCTLCEEGFNVDPTGSCVTTCPEGSSRVGNMCHQCASGCEVCLDSGFSGCLACRQDLPLTFNGACYATCPDGTFQSEQTCVRCDSACAKCTDGADYCTQCPAGRFLMPDGTCVGACPAGHFARSAESGGHICQPCDSSCVECDAADSCTVCQPGDKLHKGRCLDACPAGSLACSQSPTCISCPAGCQQCELAVDTASACSAICVQCSGDLYLTTGKEACVEQCPHGSVALAGSFYCDACDSHCQTCRDSTSQCTSCADPTAWLRQDTGACVGACPSIGMVPVEFPGAAFPDPARVCLSCPVDCDACAAPKGAPEKCELQDDRTLDCPTVFACERCTGPLLLVSPLECSADCPDGTFADPDAEHGPVPACVSCPEGCLECTSLDNCTVKSSNNRALAIGLGVGLSLLVLLIVAGVVAIVMLRKRSSSGSKDAMPMNSLHG
ncbi:hypothetical protein H696_05413 [Fonticula alba]|uniref:EGF-like domain-containing protein n=1 Tax=Fonticula alba TaxID=691883 RepID=A0A058Z3P8_FONAL|nr:hypothetical protein H696_05413 [Fonticula alba]KCV68147.1 hypothetical protein H696_05413 [Fonticula alba]|eukprot:XP_009497521.1 hypothetical protein H696_05413 [Fonticula alba]